MVTISITTTATANQALLAHYWVCWSSVSPKFSLITWKLYCIVKKTPQTQNKKPETNKTNKQNPQQTLNNPLFCVVMGAVIVWRHISISQLSLVNPAIHSPSTYCNSPWKGANTSKLWFHRHLLQSSPYTQSNALSASPSQQLQAEPFPGSRRAAHTFAPRHHLPGKLFHTRVPRQSSLFTQLCVEQKNSSVNFFLINIYLLTFLVMHNLQHRTCWQWE